MSTSELGIYKRRIFKTQESAYRLLAILYSMLFVDLVDMLRRNSTNKNHLNTAQTLDCCKMEYFLDSIL